MNLVSDSVPDTPCDVRSMSAATANRDSGRAPFDPECIERASKATGHTMCAFGFDKRRANPVDAGDCGDLSR